LIPVEPTVGALRDAAARCTGCELYKNATQTVFGEGPERARVMLVGEQPGDAEDLAGHPFVGPAGRLLDRCLVEAAIDRKQTYVTNVVKYFKWVPRGRGAFTANRARSKSRPAFPGSRPRSASSNRKSSWRSARPRRRRCSEELFG
jgi:uracil-DNA glycosylase